VARPTRATTKLEGLDFENGYEYSGSGPGWLPPL